MKDIDEGMPLFGIKAQPERFIENPIIQTLACFCASFNKSTILKISALVGRKMSNTKSFLERYISEGVIYELRHSATYSDFFITEALWFDIIRGIKPERLDTIVQTVQLCEPSNDARFAQAVSLFFQGKEFKQLLTKKTHMNRFETLNYYKDYLLVSMIRMGQMIPFILELDQASLKTILDELLYRLHTLDFTEADATIAEQLTQSSCSLPKAWCDEFRFNMALYKDVLCEANLEKATQRCAENESLILFVNAFSQLQKGDYDAAYKQFLKMLKGTGDKHFFDFILNFYYAIALANTSIASAQTKIGSLFKQEDFGIITTDVMQLLLRLAKEEKKQIDLLAYQNQADSLVDRLLLLLVAKHYKLGKLPNEDELLAAIEKRSIRLMQVEFSSVHAPFATLLTSEDANPSHLHPSLPPYHEREEWDLKLEELLKLNRSGVSKGKAAAPQGGTQRIIYEVNTCSLSVQPRMQKSKDGINWSSGRNISLEKFSKGLTEGMSDQDRSVAACVASYSYGWYGGVTYELQGGKAVASLIGHPYVFDSGTGNHIDVVSDKPQISVKLQDGQYVVKCNVNTKEIDGGYFTIDEGNSLKIIKIPTKTRKTIDLLSTLTFPEQAKERLIQLLELLSDEMVVMGDLLKHSEHIVSCQAHAETIVRLNPSADAIRCQLIVRPFGKVPPVCKPGKGMQVITTTIEGKQVQTKRNLKKEKEYYEQVQQLMVDFEEDPYEDYTWQLAPEECLTLLEQLQAMKQGVRVEWPEGEKMKVVRQQLTPSDFHLKLNSAASWFELTGDVDISAEKKLKMAELVERLAQTKGNFIQLSNEEFVRISADLRRHIDTLARVASINRGKLRIAQWNAPMLESLAEDGIALASDKAYKQLLERINNSNQTEIKVPKTINADLRSYQKEGYLWMSRLALWGAGALLADDMGLGKTLQAITLMLSRAAAGPQLVVVPTSVTLNWRDEIARFAPSLHVRLLNALGEDREAMIRDAKPFDVIITTYGLLSNEEEQLVSRTWNTIVLDEAHTIKNRETKMSQSAMKLKADFRLLLTGTPLQNHVSEMWNLMQFANPNLLGTFQEFTARFLLPIERDHDKERQRLLKRIITPFILRRTKSEVLNELPEKTEIMLKVDLSAEEWAFYDNIRQKALAEIEEKSATAMQALAEITRLRQAACNVRLVESNLHLPSSKLERFMQIVDELHANHHRALVFSQFTSHLALVRERLDSEGISYLYLDGSTTAKERIRLVEQYQQGDVSLFLISLKAGGLGLNLTAADYVVHLDPWWNPAIEEQASDRAYRIGQRKPVTVYRLISAGTIEEKIIELHQTKKNMADALLEGGDISASLSREEMLELLSSL